MGRVVTTLECGHEVDLPRAVAPNCPVCDRIVNGPAVRSKTTCEGCGVDRRAQEAQAQRAIHETLVDDNHELAGLASAYYPDTWLAVLWGDEALYFCEACTPAAVARVTAKDRTDDKQTVFSGKLIELRVATEPLSKEDLASELDAFEKVVGVGFRNMMQKSQPEVRTELSNIVLRSTRALRRRHRS